MKTNIRIILLGELILLVAVFGFNLILTGWSGSFLWFIDLPSLLLIVLVLVPGLMIMREWKDFVRSFSVGIRQYSLLELKNITEAVIAAQKLTVYGSLFAILVSLIVLLGKLDEPSSLGPNMAVCLLTGFYAVVVEFFLLPLRLNVERKMNEEMDMEDV